MKAVYIAGSYRANTTNGIHENIQKARKVALKYWKKGYAVICPHLNSAFMDGACDDSIWLKGGLELLRRCDIIVMMKDWYLSEGSVAEHTDAVKHGIKIVYE